MAETDSFEERRRELVDAGRASDLVALYRDERSSSDEEPELDRLAEDLEELARGAESDERAAELWLECGDVSAEIGDVSKASDAYQNAYGADPSTPEALRRVRRLYREEGLLDGVQNFYDVELRSVEEDEARAELLLGKAQIEGDYRGDLREAVELAERAVEADPDLGPAEEIRDIYAAGGTVEAEVDDYAELAADAQMSGDPKLAAELFADAARLEAVREGGGSQRARALFGEARRLEPTADDVRAVGRRYFDTDPAEEAERVREVGSEEGEVREEGSVDPASARPDVYWDSVDAEALSVEQARERLEDSPGDTAALSRVRGALVEDEQFEELAERLESALDEERDSEVEPVLLADLGTLYWQSLEDLDRAEYFFRRLKVQNTRHPAVLDFYEDYFEREENWRRLFSLLKVRAEAVEEREVERRAVERRAEVAEEEMGSPQRAIDVWKDYLRRHDGDDVVARERLRELFEANERWSGLIDFLKEEVERLENERPEAIDERASLLERIAELYGEIGNDVMSINVLQEVLELDPMRDSAFERVRALLRENSRWRDLGTLLADRADRLAGAGRDGEAVELYAETAELCRERFQNPSRAIPHLERLLEIDPDREEARQTLAQVHRDRRDWESLYDLRRDQLEQSEGEADVELLEELRELATERLDDPDRAAPVLEEMFERGEGGERLLRDLEEVYRDRGDWESLQGVLRQRAVEAEGASERYEALAQVARVCDDKLDDPEGAAQVWREILDHRPDHDEAFAELTDIYLESDDFDALEELYAERERFDRLFDLFDSAARTRSEAEEQRALYRRMSRLAEDELEDPNRRILSLESLADVVEDRSEVLDELAEAYRRGGDRERELEARREQVDGVETPEIERLERVARLESEVGSPARALDLSLDLLRRDPERTGVLDSAEASARQTGSLSRFVEAAVEVVEEIEDEARIALLSRVAPILADDLGEPERALELYEEIRDQRPDDPEVLGTLAELYGANGRMGDRESALRAQIEARRERGDDPRAVVPALLELAELRAEALDDPEGAVSAYERALSASPGEPSALRGLQSLYRRREAYDELAEALQRELEAAAEGAGEAEELRSARDVRLDLAELYRWELDRPEQTLELYRELLEEEPGTEPAVEGLEALVDTDCGHRALEVLEEHHRETGRHDQLVEVLEARFDGAEDDGECAEIAGELASLARDRLDDPDRAFDWAVRQFRADPGAPETRERLEDLADRTGRWDELDEAFAGASPLADSVADDERSALLRRLADLRLNERDDVDGALEALEALREQAPADRELLERLETLYRRAGRTEALVELIVDRAEWADDPVERLEEAARLCEDSLEDLDRAADLRGRVVEERPEDEAAMAAYETALNGAERWGELAELYEERVERAEDDETRAERELELARLRFEKLDDFEAAVDLLAPRVDGDSVDDSAVEALESIDVTLIKDERAHLDLRMRVAEVLEPVYRDRGDLEQLAYVLGIQLRGLESVGERVELLEERAELYDDELSRPEDAFEDLAQAVELDPSDDERRQWLESLAERAGALDDLVDAYDRASEASDETEVTDELDFRIGGYSRQLGDRDRAIEAYERIRQRGECEEDALEALEELYSREDRTADLADILWRRVERGERDEGATLLKRLAEIERTQLGRSNRAVIAYERLLEREPRAAEAIDTLAGLYEEHGRWHDLADVVEHRADVADSDDERVAALLRLGRICERDEVDDRERAIEAYRRAVECDPDRPDALSSLDRLFAEDGQAEERAQVLQRRLRTTEATDLEARREIELELAGLFQSELGRPDDAFELYRVVLERNDGQPDAVEGLAELVEHADAPDEAVDLLADEYRAAGAWEELADVHRRRRQRASDPEHRAAASFDLADVLREHLDEPEAAADALADAWVAAPGSDTYRAELVELLSERGEWERLAEIRRDVLAAADDPERRVDMHLEQGDLLGERLDRLVDAEQAYRRALAIDEACERAYDRLEELLEQNERWLDLVDLLEQRLETVDSSDPERTDRLVAIAEIYGEKLGDRYEAAETWERVLEHDRMHQEALDSLGELYREQEKWQALADHLERRLELTEEPEALVARVYELAEVTRSRLYRPDHALELYERILVLDPEHEPTIESLESMLSSDEGGRARAAPLLAKAYRSSERWEELVDVLVESADAADGPEETRDRLHEAFEVARREFDDLEAARDVVARTLRAAPLSEEVRADVRAFAREHGAWSFLDELYGSILDSELPPGEPGRAEVLIERARWVESRVEDLERAVDLYREALIEEPGREEAAEGLERVLARVGDWEGAADLLRERAARSDRVERADRARRRAARMHEWIRGAFDAAAELWSEVLETRPGDGEAIEALWRIERRRGDWKELAARLRRAVDAADDPSVAAAMRHRLARLSAEKLDAPSEAYRLYAEELENDSPADRTLRGLERLESTVARAEGDSSHLRRQIVERLAEHADPSEDWRRAAELAERAAALDEEPTERANWHLEAAEAIGAGAEAEIERVRMVEQAARARALAPEDDRAGDVLERAAEEVGRWASVPRVFAEVAEDVDDPRRRAELALEAGDVWRERLDNSRRAASAYRLAFELDGSGESLARLTDVLAEIGRPSARATFLEERVDRAADAGERIDLLERLAHVYREQLDAPERAAECYRAILDEQPGTRRAVEALESIYEETGEDRRLADLLEWQIDRAEDAAQREQFQRRLAAVQERALGAPEEAIETYHALLGRDETDPEALDALDRLYRETERWEELLRVLELRRDGADEPEERDALDVERAEVRAERLDDGEAALSTYAEVLERSPDHERALAGLRELVEREDVGDRATDRLAERLREEEAWSDLRDVLEMRFEAVDESQAAAQRSLELAGVLEDRLDNPDMAFVSLGRGLREAPESEQLRADLHRLSDELGDGDELFAIYEDVLERGVDSEQGRLELHCAAAELAEEELDDVESAVEHAEAASTIAADHRPTLERLDRLYQREHAWEELGEILERRIELADEEATPEMRYRLGYLLEQYLDDPSGALEAYRRVLDQQTGHGGAVEGLERLVEDEGVRGEAAPLLEPVYEEQERFDDLVDLLELELEEADDRDRRAELLKRSGELLVDELGDADRGWAALSRALRANPGDLDLRDRLCGIADAEARHEGLVALFEALAEELGGSPEAAGYARRAADRASAELDDPQRAVEDYRRALEADPADSQALDGYVDAARRSDDRDARVDALRRRADRVEEPDERRRLLHEIGTVEADRGRPERAIEALETARGLDESDADVLRSLVDLYEETDQHRALIETLESLERSISDSGDLVEIHEKIARFARRGLDDVERALEANRTILRHDPEHREALAELEELYRESDQRENLRDLLVRQFEVAADEGDTEEAARAGRELGRLVEETFDDVPGAIHWLERAVECAPDDRAARDELSDLYRRAERWSDLVDLHETRLERSGAESDLGAALEMGRICLDRLGDPDRAESHLDRAHEIAPGSPDVLDLRIDLLHRREDWETLAALLKRRAAKVGGGERERELRLERGELLRSRLEAPGEAAEEFERALDLGADDERVLGELAELYRQSGRNERLFEVLARRVEITDRQEIRGDLAVEMAGLVRAGVGDGDRAIDALRTAREEDPTDPGLARTLARSLEEEGEIEEAADILEEVTDRDELPDEERAELLHIRGQLAESSERPEEALDLFRRVAELDEEYLPNLMSLGELEYRLESYERAKERFEQLLLHQMQLDSEDEQVRVYYHLGRIEAELDNDRRARDMFDRALDVDPDHEPTERARDELD